jgi:hypothetical protein
MQVAGHTVKSPQDKVIQRPAESAAGLGGIVFVVGHALGWSQDTTNAVAVIAAATPAVVTFGVNLWRKR